MSTTNHRKKLIIPAVLSLSLLTVMAGAAVAPALDTIRQHFSGEAPLLVQMIISVPALFIIITSFVFPRLCRVMRTRTLVLTGLFLYTLGGCLAGAFNQIFLVLAARALAGVGVGIIMPLATGLLAYYGKPERLNELMGYSSAMNQLGGVIATLLSGLLATISWRASFLVYLLGAVSIVLCLLFLPNERLVGRSGENLRGKTVGAVWKRNYGYIVAMFLLMVTFFIYPADFALETMSQGMVPAYMIAPIMAGMDLVAFVGGLLFASFRRLCGRGAKYCIPLLFGLGYACLALVGGWFGVLAGSACVGFANGVGVPFIIAAVSHREGREAATTVLPLISMALYAAQFLTPIIVAATESLLPRTIASFPYYLAMLTALCLLLWSRLTLREPTNPIPGKRCKTSAYEKRNHPYNEG